tara:strand:+ start:1931 stop:2749 length:819 start_codon:yes stop_codon:yes gene_type:complete
MNQLKMFCLCIHNDLLPKLKNIDYIPVGLGDDQFDKGWLTDKAGDNISAKNKYYGEYTFHYWLWKNEIKNIDSKNWIGFCAYRRFWSNERITTNKNQKFKDKILKSVPQIWNEYDVILGNKISMSDIKWIKILKYGKISLIKNPKAVFKNNRNIKFHFDMFHGNGMLDKAIDILDPKDRNDFREFVNSNHSFNQGNMFISKSKKLITEYYENIFNWLFECEKIFGFNLQGYSNMRIYAFLAERFLPFWFNKYANCLEWPIIFQDLRKENLSE